MGGIEYLITPSSPPEYPLVYPEGVSDPDPDGPDDTESRQWKTTKIGVPVPNPLNNFRVSCRYVDEQMGPSGLPVKQYPGFELISQTLEAISPSGGDVFVEGTPPEYEDYPEFPTFTAPLGDYPASAYAVAGITDGAAYQYAKVFDQTEWRLIPRGYEPPQNPPLSDGSERVDEIPLEPYDPEEEIFPYTSITHYEPDTRLNVLVTFQLTTTLEGKVAPAPPGPDPVTAIRVTDTINITQWVQQSIYDWGPACRWYACRGKYAYNGSDNYCPVGDPRNEYPI